MFEEANDFFLNKKKMNIVHAMFRRRALNQFLYFPFCDLEMSKKKQTIKPFEFFGRALFCRKQRCMNIFARNEEVAFLFVK